MRFPAPSMPAAVVLAGVVCGCGAETVLLDWRLTFGSSELAARASIVEARILAGSCRSTDVVYAARFEAAEAAPAPPSLDEGTYGFEARALDRSCHWYVAGCEEARLPRSRSNQVTVRLNAMTEPERDCAACSGACESDLDASTSPDVTQPTEASDARSMSDSADGGPALDAGPREAEAGDDIDGGPEADAGEPPPPFVLRIEAEDAASVTLPFQVLADEEALGGQYVCYPYDEAVEEPITAFRRVDPPTLDSDGLATYPFDIPRSGSYRLWAHVVTATLDEDSFWIKMDDQDWILWNDIPHASAYEWVDVRIFDQRVQMLVFQLDAGPHRLVVGYRELNARLDQLLITDDLTLTPTN